MEKLSYSGYMPDGSDTEVQYSPPPNLRTENATPIAQLDVERRSTRRGFLKLFAALGLASPFAAFFGWHVLGPKMQEARAITQMQSSQPEPKPEPKVEDPREQLRKRQLQDELNNEVIKQGGIPESGPFAGKGR